MGLLTLLLKSIGIDYIIEDHGYYNNTHRKDHVIDTMLGQFEVRVEDGKVKYITWDNPFFNV